MTGREVTEPGVTEPEMAGREVAGREVAAIVLRVDRDRCAGSGMCALTAPEVFDQDTGDGRVLLLDARPPAGPAATAAREAAGLCPAGAIAVRAAPVRAAPARDR